MAIKVSRAAKRYVKAFFEWAKEEGTLEELVRDMHMIVRAFEESKDLNLFLKHPAVSGKKKKEVILKLFENFSPSTLKVIELLEKKGRLSLLGEIAQGLVSAYKKYTGKVEALLITAVEPNAELEKEIRNKIKEITGKDDADLTVKVDPEIIGGYILQIGDLRIDDSIKTKLKKIEKQLTQ